MAQNQVLLTSVVHSIGSIANASGSAALGSSNIPGFKYPQYKSPFGPKYAVQANIQGFTVKSVAKLGVTLGGFGAAFGFAAIYLLSDAPRFRKDLMQKIPILGKDYIREIPASDNIFGDHGSGKDAMGGVPVPA